MSEHIDDKITELHNFETALEEDRLISASHYLRQLDEPDYLCAHMAYRIARQIDRLSSNETANENAIDALNEMKEYYVKKAKDYAS